MAWVETYAFPARMFMGTRRDEGGDAARGGAGRRATTPGTASPRSRGDSYQRLIDLARSSGPPMRGKVRTNIVDLRTAMPSDRAMAPEERHRLRLSLAHAFKRDAVPLSRP